MPRSVFWAIYMIAAMAGVIGGALLFVWIFS